METTGIRKQFRDKPLKAAYFADHLICLINEAEELTQKKLPKILRTNALLLVGLETRNDDILEFYRVWSGTHNSQAKVKKQRFGQFILPSTLLQNPDNINCYNSFLSECERFRPDQKAVDMVIDYLVALRKLCLNISCESEEGLNSAIKTLEVHVNFINGRILRQDKTWGVFQQAFAIGLDEKPVNTLLSLISHLFLDLTRRDGTNPSWFDLYFAACPICHKIFSKARFDQRFDTNSCKQKFYRTVSAPRREVKKCK